MARQRFIWPSIWGDPEFGRLTDSERVLFIGLFSNADDEGRILADPSYLRSTIWPFSESLTGAKVRAIRDSVCKKCSSVLLYQANGNDYIELQQWDRYQKPKYPKPSTLPPPSGSVPETLGESSGNVPPQGWVGLGRDGLDKALSSNDNTRGETVAASSVRDAEEAAHGLVQRPGEDHGTVVAIGGVEPAGRDEEHLRHVRAVIQEQFGA